MRCPLCQTDLPDTAASCSRCDWVRNPRLPPSRRDDWKAVALSVVPGLGHLYKGHLVPGVMLLCVLGPAYLTSVFVLIPLTFGLSLILPALFVVVVAVHAFHLKNVRRDPGALEHARITLRPWLERITRNSSF